MFTRKSIPLILISLILVSCAGPSIYGRYNRMRSSYVKIRPSISVGDDKQNVISKLDKIQKPFSSKIPSREMESLTLKKGQVVDIYYMRINWFSDGLSTDDEFTPYVFVDDKLVAIGWKVLGGAKTKHDPRLVEINERNQLRAMEAGLQAAQAIQGMGRPLNQTYQTYQIQQQRQLDQHNEGIRQQQMRELNRNLQQLNRKFGN